MAFGDRAQAEAQQSIETLRRHCDLPVTIIGRDIPLDGDFHGTPTEGLAKGQSVFLPGRVKPRLWELSPYRQTLYLDADTRVNADPTPLFGILDAGWDLALAIGQAARFLADTKFGEAEKHETIQLLGNDLLYYYNSGVLLWAKNERTEALFRNWGDEWRHFGNWDEQLALMRALWKTRELKFMTLPICWNQRKPEGALIYHDTGNRRSWG